MVDEKTYLFELRRDARFHDGRPLTAADVKFTYEFNFGPEQPIAEAGFAQTAPCRRANRIVPTQV